MSMKSLRYLIPAGALLLSACTMPGDPALQARADQMSACEKIEALVNAYDNHFDGIKGPVLSQRFLDIWAARVDAVGRDCQVWKSASHTTYMCTRNAPGKEVGEEWFERAAAEMGQCQGGWQRQAVTIAEGAGKGAVWMRSGTSASIGLQLVPVSGRHWTLYYFVGDRDKWF